jgi:hypothetical protein
MTWQEAKRWAAQLDYGGFKDEPVMNFVCEA